LLEVVEREFICTEDDVESVVSPRNDDGSGKDGCFEGGEDILRVPKMKESKEDLMERR
jgi:hypothetical protein